MSPSFALSSDTPDTSRPAATDLAASSRSRNADIAFAVVLFLLALGVSLWGASRIAPALTTDRFTDVWFDADVSRVSKNMNGLGDHHRTQVHPLFSLLTAPPVVAVRKLTGITPAHAASVVVAVVAGLWLALLFAVLRGLGCRRPDATLLCLLAAVSSASLFSLTVPENYEFGSLSLLLALGGAVLAGHQRLADRMLLALSVVTLAITITNWMAGLVVAFTQRRWARAMGISVAALVIVAALAVVQKRVFPTAGSLFHQSDEVATVTRYSTGGPLVVGKVFFLDTIIAPRFGVVPYPGKPDHEPLLVAQRRPVGATALGDLGVFLWLVVLALGLYVAVTMSDHKALRITLAAVLAGQFLLHVLYGPESFLYTGHWLPLLIVLGALSTLGRQRRLALALIAAVVLCAAVNNFSEFGRATAHVQAQAAAPNPST